VLEHGGNLDLAVQRFGGRVQDWIDLSTGINRQPYPVGEVEPRYWNALPSRSDIESLHQAARQAYAARAPILATSGAQAVIQLLPYLTSRRRARILAPTYNEYAAAFSATAWDVAEVSDLEGLAGADLAVVVNPNNPDGRRHDPNELLSLLPRVGRLIVDESFGDAVPDASLASEAGRPGLLILRSFGKFYGLAGLRLGFVLGEEGDIATLSAMAGPWPISGAAIAIGRRALLDRDWGKTTTTRLDRDCLRLDASVNSHGWRLVGGTPLFRLYDVGNALSAQETLARGQIWSRVFTRQPAWLRLGLPGDETEWARVAGALSRWRVRR
jgi:cobalamin biosynthetic protein CobC